MSRLGKPERCAGTAGSGARRRRCVVGARPARAGGSADDPAAVATLKAEEPQGRSGQAAGSAAGSSRRLSTGPSGSPLVPAWCGPDGSTDRTSPMRPGWWTGTSRSRFADAGSRRRATPLDRKRLKIGAQPSNEANNNIVARLLRETCQACWYPHGIVQGRTFELRGDLAWLRASREWRYFPYMCDIFVTSTPCPAFHNTAIRNGAWGIQ